MEQDGQETRFGAARESESPSETPARAPLSPAPEGALLLLPACPRARSRSGEGDGDPCGVLAARGAREAGFGGSQRGLAQRHAEDSAAGGCVIISSLVTGSLSLPLCLIADCSLWQSSW